MISPHRKSNIIIDYLDLAGKEGIMYRFLEILFKRNISPYCIMWSITELSMSLGRMVATTSCRLLPITDKADNPFLRMDVFVPFPPLSWLVNLLMMRSRYTSEIPTSLQDWQHWLKTNNSLNKFYILTLEILIKCLCNYS